MLPSWTPNPRTESSLLSDTDRLPSLWIDVVLGEDVIDVFSRQTDLPILAGCHIGEMRDADTIGGDGDQGEFLLHGFFFFYPT